MCAVPVPRARERVARFFTMHASVAAREGFWVGAARAVPTLSADELIEAARGFRFCLRSW